MDILNFISWIASKRRVVTTAPDDALVPIGIRTETRDDKYTTVAIKKSDLLGSSSTLCPLTLGFKPGSIGEKVSFRKENYADPIKSRDVLIKGVLEITRGNNGGLYNTVYQSNYSNQGPLNTEWNTQYINAADTSWAPLWDIQNRTYLKWQVAIETPGTGNAAPPQYVGMHTIMRELTTNTYWLIIFTEWTPGGNGGGFAYDRYQIFPEVYFNRPNYQFNITDKISDGVIIARESNGGQIFNLVSENSANNGLSPENTRWNSQYTDTRTGYSGFTDLSNLESRVYADFTDALNGQVGNNVLNTDLIMHDLTTDLYYKVVFDSWQQGGNGGGFSYYRTVIPQSCSVTFADGTVLNTASTGGSVTTCCYTDINNNLIAADSSNNLVNLGPGGTQDIPDFSGLLLVNDHFNGGVEMWLCGGGMTTVLVSSTPYGPGPGDVTINGGVNGYTWTNINNQVGPFTFTVIKTRQGS